MNETPPNNLPALPDGASWVMHTRGKAAGVRRGRLVYTHNMALNVAPSSPLWRDVDAVDVPVYLYGYARAACRHAHAGAAPCEPVTTRRAT